MRLICAVVVLSTAMVSSSPYSAEMVSGAESNHQHEDFQSSAIPPLFENVRSWPRPWENYFGRAKSLKNPHESAIEGQ